MNRKGISLICVASVLSSLVTTSSPAFAQPELFIVARYAALRGDTSCAYGDRYCNRCAHDVEGQFTQMLVEGNYVATSSEWTWRMGRRYEPSNISGREAFEVGPGGGSHVQGFVRAATTTPDAPAFFVTYGDEGGVGEENPALFGISGPAHGGSATGVTNRLKYIFRAPFGHPGGMQALGHFVLTAMKEPGGGAFIEVRDIDQMPSDESSVLQIYEGEHNASNVASARLASGGYVILTNESAGRNEYNLFYSTSLEDPALEEIWHGDIRADGSPGGIGFQNLSMVTECETGLLYVLGITRHEGLPPLQDPHWVLYRLDPTGADHGPQLTYVTENILAPAAVTSTCNLRAAGSAFVSEDGELYLYCHEKQARSAVELVNLGFCVVTAGVFCPDLDSDLYYVEIRPD